MSYTTYIWKTNDPAGYRQEYSAHSLELDNCQTCYYAGRTSQHLEARLLSPYPAITTTGYQQKHRNRDSVEVLWSKEYDDPTDASSIENSLINWLWKFEKDREYAFVLNKNSNLYGVDLIKEKSRLTDEGTGLLEDVKGTIKIVKQDYAKVATLIEQKHKERLQEAIEARADKMTKDNEEIQVLLARYVKNYQKPNAKQARTKSEWNIADMQKTISTLKQTLATYKITA